MPSPHDISARDSLPPADPNDQFPREHCEPPPPEAEAWGTVLNPVRDASPIGPSYPVGPTDGGL